MDPKLQYVLNSTQVGARRLCVNGTPWIWRLLEQCVESQWDYWSIVAGLVSIVCFLLAALPQLYVAYKNGNVDQALSLGFLLCWLSGDVANFIGCYLTNQLPIQTVTAIFYINMDVIVISQFAYYKLMHHKKRYIRAWCWKDIRAWCWKGSSSLKAICFSWIIVFITLSIILPSHFLLRIEHRTELDSNKESFGISEMSGFICGYISSVFYLGSRFPQMYKNFKRKSTEGTSYMLFALAMMGNCTYGLSLLLKMPAIGHYKGLFAIHHLPWLIGSFGVLVLDFFITAQFILYQKNKTAESNTMSFEVKPLLNDEDSS